jgi:hypothetical protein
MKSITKYINEAQNTEKVIRFNTAELTYVYNVLMNDGGSLDDDVFDELQDYLTNTFGTDTFDIEEDLWVEYKDKTKAAGRSDKYNDVKSRDKHVYRFTDDEFQIFVDFINKDLKYNGKDADRKKIGEQVLKLIEMNRALGNGTDSQRVKRAVYEHPDYIVGLSTGLDYRRGSAATYPQIKSFDDLKRKIEWGATTEVKINDKDKKIEVHVYSVHDME